MKCKLPLVRALIALLFVPQFLDPFSARAQANLGIVKGIVHNENNQPLSDASVVIRNTQSNFTTGTKTDTAGVFTASVPAGGPYQLSFSNVGYEPQTLSGYNIKAGAIFTVDVQMKATAGALDQVVVVGYGSKKRSDVTGSVASVPQNRLTQLPVTNVLQAIQGAVAGVNITQSSSVPGASPSAVIRGESSISAATGPFIVVDGVPFNGTLNDVNPNDIASIDILKDASSTAIYGTRGANGVILITTKRGRTGKAAISYTVSHRLTPPCLRFAGAFDLQKESDAKYRDRAANVQHAYSLAAEWNFAKSILRTAWYQVPCFSLLVQTFSG